MTKGSSRVLRFQGSKQNQIESSAVNSQAMDISENDRVPETKVDETLSYEKQMLSQNKT